MISKDMYTLLSAIPKTPKEIQYKDLLNGLLEKGFNPSLGHDLLVDACYIELQDRGAILIEEYERNIRSDVLMEKAYKTSQYAMWAAIASAIAAVVGLLCSMWKLVLSAIEKIARMF